MSRETCTVWINPHWELKTSYHLNGPWGHVLYPMSVLGWLGYKMKIFNF